MKRPLIRILRAVLVAFVLLNGVVFWHTWRMTHFGPPETEVKEQGGVAKLFRGMQVPKSMVTLPAPRFSEAAQTVDFVTRDGVKLEAWVIPAAGSRGVVMVFHGYVGSRSGMLGEARALHELGWSVVVVDLRGSGGSDGFVSTFGWREAEDVTAGTNWARRQWPEAQIVLYGKSMGAAAVLRAVATEGVRVDGLILECPFDRLVTMIGRYYEILGLPAFPLAQLSLVWGGVQHGFNPFRHNPVSYANAVTCPVLLLEGTRDPYVRTYEARRIVAAMRGPTTFHIFESGGHGEYSKSVPDEYRKTVADWLARLAVSQKSDTGR